LETLFESINSVPDFSDVFQQPLEELFLTIRNAGSISYNKIFDNLTNTINLFDQIQNEINAKTEPHLKNILDASDANIEAFLYNHVSDASNIYEASKAYYSGVVDAINTRLEILKQNKSHTFDFDITTFYDIKDIYTKVLNIFTNLNQRILDAISVERINFMNQVNEQFDSILNDPLKNVEIIAYNARNNISVIDALNLYYKESGESGEEKRELLINNINSLRVRINNMLTSIYNKIQETYNTNFLNSTSYQRIKQNIENYTNEIQKNQKSLMEFLSTFIHYDLNFDIYVEDVRVLLDVNYKASKSRESNYNKIYNKIKGIVDSYLTQTKLNTINQNLNSYLDKVIKAVQNFNYGHALANITQLSNAIETVINNNLGKKVYDAVVSRYTDKTTLDNMLKDYYTNVYTAYLEFNTTFFTNHFLAHANKYVSKPEEIIAKFNKILKAQEEEEESQVNNINTLIVNSINSAIESSYYSIYQLVVKLKEEFLAKAPKNIYGNTGNYRAKYEEVLRKLDDLLTLFLNNNGEMNITHKYKRTKIDEFSLNKTIHSEEYKIYLMLYTISDELENKSLRYICNGNAIILCNNASITQAISAIDQFNYQMAKLRDSITQLKNLIPIVETMMNDTLLELDPQKYLELYKKQSYKDFQIVAEFRVYLDAIREETNKQMEGFANQIKVDIINAYKENINNKGIEEAIKNLALKVFVNPENLKEKLRLYMDAICGPINKIINIFTEEIKYYTFEKHSLDITAYEASYAQLVSELDYYYNDKENKLLDNFKLKDITYINLMAEFYLIIDSGYENLKEIVKSIGSFEFQFLDHKYTFNTLVEEALNEIRDEFQANITDLVNNYYDESLKELKTIIKDTIKTQYNEILKTLHYQYNATFTKLELYKGPNKITEISVYPQIKSILEDFFEKVRDIYDPEELNNELLNVQTEELNDNGINIEIVFDNTIGKLNQHIQNFLVAAQKRAEDEKLEFLSKIEPGFINGFIRTVKDFLSKDGINALNNLFKSDYESTIKHEFKYLINETTSIKEYMEVLLDSPDVKSVSVKLGDSLKVIYKEMNNEFKKIISVHYNNVVYPRILDFENQILELIPTYFIENLKVELKSSNFKTLLNNERVLKLIPTIFPEGFKANLTTHLKNELYSTSLTNFKNSYQSLINSDLSKFLNHMLELHNYIRNLVAEKSSSQTSPDMTTTINIYDTYKRVVDNYNSTFNFEVNTNKIGYIKNFFNNRLLSYITIIRTAFNNGLTEAQTKILNAMNRYQQEQIFEKVKNDLSNSKISSSVNSVNSNLTAVMNQLNERLKKVFNANMKNLLVNACAGISVDGFKLTERRNLAESKDYNLNQINSYISFIHNRYKEFNQTVLTNKNFVSIRTKEGSFYNMLLNAVLNMDNYFYFYQYLIKEYTELRDFTQNYQAQSKNVKDYIKAFLLEQAGKIDDVVNVIRNNVVNSWNRNKATIKKTIKDALDEEFRILLSGLKELKHENLLLDKVGETLGSIDLYNNKQEKVLTVELNTLANNLKYGYSITPKRQDNFYNFNVGLYTSGSLSLQIKTQVDNLFKFELNGVLGSGTIGFNNYYDISDKSVEIEAYAKSDNSTYISLREEFNLQLAKFELQANLTIKVMESETFKFNKVLRHYQP